MNLHHLINTYDIYGIKPKFNLGGHKTKGTPFGLFSSLLTLLLMLSAGIYFTLDLFQKQKVTVVSSVIKTKDISNVTLSNSSFFFTIALEDPNTYNTFIDEGIYKAEAFYKQSMRLSNGTIQWKVTKLNMTVCSKEYFGQEYIEGISKLAVTQMYCVPNINLDLFGTFLSDSYSFIFIQISECKNNTQSSLSSHCKPKDIIDYYLNGTFIQFVFQDNTINPNNYTRPNQPIINEFYTSISHLFFKEIHMLFKQITIKSDSGILFEDVTIMNFTQYDKTIDMFSFKEGGYFGEITIKLSDCIDQVSRTYVKAQTVIANIGGVIQFIKLLFFVLNIGLNITALDQYLINKIYFIGEECNKGRNSNSNIVGSGGEICSSIGNSNSKGGILTSNKSIMKNYHNASIKYYNNNEENISPVRSVQFKLMQNNINSYHKPLSQFKLQQSQPKLQSQLESQLKQNKAIIPIGVGIEGGGEDKEGCIDRKKSFWQSSKFNKNSIVNMTQLIKFKQSRKMHISLCQSLVIYLRRQHKQKGIIAYYHKGVDLLKKRLDVVNMIKESYWNELVKLFILDEKQMKLINICSKPEINVYGDDKRNLTYRSEEVHVGGYIDPRDANEHKDVINAYLDIKNRKHQSKIDKDLLNKFENTLMN